MTSAPMTADSSPPTRLRCDHRDDPPLVAGRTPFLSWQPPRDLAAVAARFAFGGDLADEVDWCAAPGSGLVWPGPSLGPLVRVAWRVQVRDADGRASAWSEPATFTTGVDAWPAPWLAPDASLGAPLLRAVVDGGAAAEATWYVACCGIPVLTCNGHPVSEPGLADYQQDPRHRVEYRAWPIPAAAWREGANVLGIHLGGGFHERFGHGPRAVSSFVVLRRADGATLTLVPPAEDWRWRPGPVRRDDPYDGVIHDDRRRPVGWDTRECEPDATWRVLDPVDPPPGRTVAAPAPTPGIVEARPPTRIDEVHESARVYDFGSSIVGGLRLRADWRNNKVLTMRFAEECDPAGHLLVRGNRQALCTDRFVAGKDPAFEWLPHFAHRGFRYCELSTHGDWPDDLRVDAVGCHDRAAPTASFACAHEGLTELFAASVRTFRQNLVGMLRDCPQRDERLGWLGDAHAVVPSVLLATDAAATIARWCDLIADTQDPARHLRTAPMAPIEPLHATGYRHPTPPPFADLDQADGVYTAAGTLLPWQCFQATGDRRILAAHFPAIADHLATWRARPDWPLIDSSPHGDHAAFPVDGTRTPKPLVAAAILLEEFRAALAMARILERDPGGLADDEATLAAALRDRHGADFVDPDASQGTLAIGLDLGLAPEPGRAAAALHARLERDGFHVGTGIILTRHLLRACADHGLCADAWKVVTREDCPGWLWMLREGPGTLHENLVDDWRFVSRNQPALGVVVEWMLRDLLGVRRVDGGASSPVYSVVPPDLPDLDWAEGSVPTPHGPIRVAWTRRADGSRAVDVDAPASCTFAQTPAPAPGPGGG